ncbi:hypothetical protein ACH35V_24065 [Actinomadura sp. 1N219]|uniref:hypothetical protein n=1 Tax=Actinomadura sp. 1N219 TaxID=3375152 RepID=UPI0037B55DD7
MDASVMDAPVMDAAVMDAAVMDAAAGHAGDGDRPPLVGDAAGGAREVKGDEAAG